MPIYKLSCKECKFGWEDLLEYEEATTMICPKCGKKVKFEYNGLGIGVVFNAPDFYSTEHLDKKD